MSKGDSLNEDELLTLAIDTASVMVVLEHSKIVHRDIAARNFLGLFVRERHTALIDSTSFHFLVDVGNRVKLSDFGMARAIAMDSGKDYYVPSSNVQLPIRWSAPECTTRSKFSAASDRYSFGIVLWEIWTKGAVPFGGLTNHVCCVCCFFRCVT